MVSGVGGSEGPVVTVTGRLRVVEVETPHFEVEPWSEKGAGPVARYVLIPADEGVARRLAASVGAAVQVEGIRHEGPGIFMRGAVLRVTAVTPLDFVAHNRG